VDLGEAAPPTAVPLSVPLASAYALTRSASFHVGETIGTTN
jgi:hypothetical protein